MRYGFIVPRGDVHAILELASEAESVGWDGFFYYDSVYYEWPGPMYDPWVLLAAVAMRTERVRLGAVLTPLSRRRPWKVARETVTLDHLSGGRLVLPVGLGAIDDGGFEKVGEVTDRKVRAELLDESLDIIMGLWSGQPFSYQGKHYQVGEMTFVPPPVQSPRISIWVVGAWPRQKSMRRAMRYDGLLPAKINPDGTPGDLTPDDVRAMKACVEEHRSQTTPFDIVWEGRTPGGDPERAAEMVRPWAEAGATWWMEAMWEAPNELDDMRVRVRQGPPRPE